MSTRDVIVLGSSSQQHTRFRNHGAYLVRWNNEGFLFDPGEGTQRQFIFAGVAPPTVTRIFISHFHGDHCLGFGSILLRLNLDKVEHEIHCYYPASGQVYFDRLRYGSIYHETIRVVLHPVAHEGLVEDDGKFRIEAFALDHGVDNFGWRIQESSVRKFHKEKLRALGLDGPIVRRLQEEDLIEWQGKKIHFSDVGWVRRGDILAVAIDTLPTANLVALARDASLFICESTYLDRDRDLAQSHMHLTAKQAAGAAKQAGARHLLLTHFSARYQDMGEFAQEAGAIFPRPWIAEDLQSYPFPRHDEHQATPLDPPPGHGR